MRLLLLLIAASFALWGQSTSDILQAVEKRYNTTKTLQANFTMTLKDRGRARLPERGVLYLTKGSPSRTRWDYSDPAGNFFLSDGKFVYDYDKRKNEATREPYKETEDTRIPLSFLLGQLNFDKDFERFEAAPAGTDTAIRMTPRNKKLAFREISITVTPGFSIRRVVVTDQPGTLVMEYTLDAEQRNLKLADALFRFTAPSGAKVVE
jgi:chaperone LolA